MSKAKEAAVSAIAATAFELDFDIYFWMVDMTDITDDQRNVVNNETKTVRLYREHTTNLITGVYVAKLLLALRKLSMKKSKKPFSLDPTLASLKNQNIPATRQYNWHLITSELKKFKIIVSKEDLKKIVTEQNHSIIIKVLQKLKATEEKIQTLINSPRIRGESLDKSPERADINSEINYGSLKKPIENLNVPGSLRKADSFVDGVSEYQQVLDPEEQSIGGDMRLSDFQIQEVRATFNTIDADGDGIITSEELKNINPGQDKSVPEDLLQNLSTFLVFEKGGKINFEEFLQFMISRNFVKPSEVSSVDYHTPLKMMAKNTKNHKSLINLQRTRPEAPSAILNHASSHAATEMKNSAAIVEIDNFDMPPDLSKILANQLSPDPLEELPIDPNNSAKLMETTTAAQFLLQSLKLSFNLTTDQQVAGLLANNNKLLINLCIQGQKDAAYRNVQQWFWLIQANMSKLINIILSDPDRLSSIKTFNILRCGLYSRNADVANTTCRIFTKLKILLNENQGNQRILELSQTFWSWLTIKQQVPKQNNNPMKSPAKQSKELSSFLQEEGLCAFLHAQMKLGSQFTEQFCLFLLHTGANIYTEFFMNSLQNSCRKISTYLGVLHDIHATFTKNEQGKDVFFEEGILELIIDISMQVAAETFDPLQNYDIVQDRQVALTLLVDLWKCYPQFFSKRGTEAQRRTGENTLAVLKRACRDKIKTTSLHAISMLCDLLEKFAMERNDYAPTIYKSLTFLLIDTYYQVDTRQEIMHAAIRLFRKNKNIPISIMCNPYFKQLKMDLDRVSPGLNDFDANMINTTDFELLATVTVHPKFTQDMACQVITIVCKIATRSLIFTRLSLHLLMNILANFENNTQIYVHLQTTIKELFNEINSNDQTKLQLYVELLKTNPRAKLRTKKRSHAMLAGKRNVSISIDAQSLASLSQNSLDRELFEHQDMVEALKNAPGMNQDSIRSDYEQLCIQERQIVNLISVFINSGIKVVCEFIREQAIQTYLKVTEQQSIQNNGLVYILKFFSKDWQSLVSHAKASKARELRQMSAQKLQLQPQASEYAVTEHATPVKLPSIKLKRELTGKGNLTIPKPPKDKMMRNLTQVEKASTSNPYDYIELSEPRSARKRSHGMAVRSINRKIGDPVELPKVLRARERTQDGRFKLYDIDKEIEEGQLDEEDVNTAWEFLMVNERVIEAIYKRYSQISNSKQKVNTFEAMEYSTKTAVMALSEVFAFLTDFEVIGNLPHLRREDIMKIVRLINLKHQKQSYGQTCLDKQGFFEFFVQVGYHFSSMEIRRPSIFIPILWNHMKSVSLSSEKPMFQRLFSDPNSTTIGDPELIAELTRRVNQNPNYQLPPGFFKVQSHEIRQSIEPPRYLPESKRLVMQLIDDLFVEKFGFHTLKEEIETEPIWIVKVDIFNKSLKKKVKPVYMKRAEQLAIKDYSEMDSSYLDDSRSNAAVSSAKSLNQPSKRRFGPQAYPTKLAVNMKAELLSLQSRDPENSQNILDCASVLNEMINSIERGNNKLTPKTRKRIMNPYGAGQITNLPLKSSSMPKNRYEAMKQNQIIKEERNLFKKDAQQQKRDKELKDKLEKYKIIKRQEMELEREREKLKNIKQEQKLQKKKEDKEKYYEQLRQEYERERLPGLQEQKEKEAYEKRMERERKREAKRLAEEKIKNDIDNMREIFTTQKKQQNQLEQEKLMKEELDRQKFQRRQETLVQRRNTRIAARSIDSDDPPSRSYRAIEDNAPSNNLMKSVTTKSAKARGLMSPQKKRLQSAKKSMTAQKPQGQSLGAKANSLVRLDSQSPPRRMAQASAQQMQRLPAPVKQQRLSVPGSQQAIQANSQQMGQQQQYKIPRKK